MRHAATAVIVLTTLLACEGKPPVDPNNREIPWAYGPTANLATETHLRGTGKEGGAAIAKGWNCRLVDGKRLTVTPIQLAATHPLFGKATLGVSLFDKTGKDLTAFESPALTKETGTLTFEVSAEVAAKLWDLILWYRKV